MNHHSLKAPSKERLEELLSFCKIINISFNDIRLLEAGLTHTSYANETGCMNNERLEFLGDSVLGLVCADYLYSFLPEHQEGDLSRIKATVVSEDSLAEVARKLELPSYIHIGHGEEINGGRNKKAILADAMEAIIAAIYLDQGFESARNYVLSWLTGQVDNVLKGRNTNKDYKSMLQAYAQKTRGKVPEYLLDRVKGPEHNPTFYVKVFIGPKCFGPASGGNKKQAEQYAARLALSELNLIHEEED